MKKLLCLLTLMLLTSQGLAEDSKVWDLRTMDDQAISQVTFEPTIGDEYISSNNEKYLVVAVQGQVAYMEHQGSIVLPSTDWLKVSDKAAAVLASAHRIAIYCTHSDESYEPSDGYYSTNGRGSIYQVAHELATEFRSRGIDATVSDQLHHPHDAGAYRRSRQTAVLLLKSVQPECLIDLHRDGIRDPASYEATVNGKKSSKIRLLVGRGNHNAAVNKEFALQIKAIADQLYPGLIKDIYLGKGTFNQDLLPRSILLECGTYTLEKERILASMPMIADVFDHALYGGTTSSLNHVSNSANSQQSTDPSKDVAASSSVDASGIPDGFVFLGLILGIGIIGLALLSTGSWKAGKHKAGRNLSEMTGGLLGNKPNKGEDPHHS